MTSRSPKYFHHLNYSFGNEDSSVELNAMPEHADHVLCVAGSGARVLPLLARGPRRVVCVDISPAQLRLTELRIEAARALSLDQYLAFFGYPPRSAGPNERRRLFERLALTDETAAFWLDYFDHTDWRSMLYDGRWERTFHKLATLNGMLTRSGGRALFEARTAREHADYMKKSFPRRAWLLTLLLLGNPIVFNLMLYKGDFPRKNVPGTPFGFYRKAFDKLFALGPARNNFFLQIVFFGRLEFPEGNPVECQPETYRAIQEALTTTQIEYRAGDIINEALESGDAFDYVSLSDVASYFAPPREQSYLQDLRPALAKGARMVVRYYLRRPEGEDRSGFDTITDSFSDAISREKVGVYQVEVLEHRG